VRCGAVDEVFGRSSLDVANPDRGSFAELRVPHKEDLGAVRRPLAELPIKLGRAAARGRDPGRISVGHGDLGSAGRPVKVVRFHEETSDDRLTTTDAIGSNEVEAGT
jgi:hypothetical protein